MATHVLGITFCEDKCIIAVAKKEGGIQIIERDFRCVIAFGEYERIFGEKAIQQESSNRKNTITGIRHLIGRHHTDPDVQEERSFQTSNQPDGRLGIKVEFLRKDRTFSPTQIAGMMFAKLKQIVEMELKTEITDAVIGLPCFFNDVRKEAVCNAARIAGLNILEIMNETTASALNYAHSNLKADENARNAVFLNVGNIDLQVSIVQFEKGNLTTLATSVDPKFINIVNKVHHMDKIQIKETMERCLKTSGIKTEEISEVVAVGASDQPTIRNCISEVFDKQPSQINENEAVARGCALKAASLSFQNKKFKIEEVKPTFPDLYKAHDNSPYPKNLTVGNLIALMKIEEQLAQEEIDERNRLDAKKDLTDYLEQLKIRLDDMNISEDYSKDLANALGVAEDLLDKEGENILRKDFANILDEFKKHDELIENGEFQHIYSEEERDELSENEEGQHNQSDELHDDKTETEESPQTHRNKSEAASSGGVRGRAKMFEQQSETASPGGVSGKARMFEQQGAPVRSPLGTDKNQKPEIKKKSWLFGGWR